MVFVVVGCLLIALKWAEFGPVAAWPWWLVLAPFGLAMLWWWYADASGWTKRREMDRMEDRKTQRRRNSMERLGLKFSKSDKSSRRAEKRAKDRESILGSRFDSQAAGNQPGAVEPTEPKKP
jgi:small Trp-rich protein